MSCQILLDINDSPDTPHLHNHSFKRGYSSNQNNLLAYLGRILLFRRVRLLKFYMATVVVLLLLFFLFRPNHTTQHGTDQLIKFESQKGVVPEAKYVNPNDLSKDIQVNTESTQASRQSPSYDHHPKILYNVTHKLSLRDFKHNTINVMQVRIREAMKHSWDNYRRYAWGHDMLKPRSREPDHWFNLGLTIVDSVDTLMMMGLTNDVNLAVDWLENELNFTTDNENSNCFEMTIRILAGLLSAYHLTEREKLRQRAVEFGDILLHCYDTKSRIIPYSDIDLSTHRAHPPQWNPYSSLSEVASLQLEFRFLTQISGNITYEQTTFQTSIHIHNLIANRTRKLLPMYLNPSSGQLEDSAITLGARADSYYEYLLKQYLQTGIKWLEDDYLDSMDEIDKMLLKTTNGAQNYTYVAEMQIYRTTNDTEDIKFYNKMDHLVCFLPGTLALGYYHYSPQAGHYRLKYNLETPTHKLNSRYDKHLDMAKALGRTCYHMYHNMGTGLSPEITTFVHSQTDDPLVENQPEMEVQSTAAHNILRPEFVESLFYLYHITGLPIYRTQASLIFEAFQKYSRISSGYSAISDVRHKPAPDADLDELLHRHAPDRMESFWLSETLKYLYLIFCDDKHIVGTLLNDYVFNTEAHILPIV